jgi:alkylresorcinol/alkylpyrone synthase
MLETATKAIASRASEVRFDVEIAGMATAVPAHKLAQAEAARRATRIFPHLRAQETLFHNTGIASRYTCEPPDWYEREHGWEERTEVFQRHALDLLEEVALRVTEDAGIHLKDIGALIVNTITGLAVPSLDAKLMNRLGLRAEVERVPLFGLGCGGGVGGLGIAARYAQAMPGGHVLFLTVDLCSLCLRVNDPSRTMFVATALFGDGAAGVVLRNIIGAGGGGAGRGRVLAAGNHFWHGTEDIMGWDIRHDGFGVLLSPDLPLLLSRELLPALQAFLDRNGISLGELAGFLLHPGGSKVLSTVAETLNLSRHDLVHSWAVLSEFGNMSSPTALFILDAARKEGASGKHLLAAFGPGFSAYFLVVDL